MSAAQNPDSDTPTARRRLRSVLMAIGGDGLLPITLALLALVVTAFPLVSAPGSLVAADFYDLQPQDWNGTVWFYGWVQQALARGVPIFTPDIVCHPAGMALGNNFPNWVDAIMAAPLFALFDFPLSYNLFTLSIPVINTLAAYFALRAWTQHRLLAGLAAVLYGFNVYTFEEISLGRTSTALHMVIPLFVGCWTRALRTRQRGWMAWATAAGFAGALSVYYHPYFALGCVLLGVLMALGAGVLPARGVGRVRPLLAGLAVLAISLFLSGPYLYQAGYLQSRVPGVQAGSQSLPQATQAPWSPAVWRFLAQDLGDRLSGNPGDAKAPPPTQATLERKRLEIQSASLPADFPLWGTSRTVSGGAWALGAVFLGMVLALALALTTGKRGLGWALAGLTLWLLGMGPWMAWSTGSHVLLVELLGHTIPLPFHALAAPLAEWSGFIKPIRFYPHFLLTVVVLLVLGTDALLARLHRHLQQSPRAARWQLATALCVPIAICAPRLVGLGDGVATYHNLEPWQPSAYLEQLGSQPDGGAIIELPLGSGHSLGPLQLVHHRARADNMADDLDALTAGRLPRDGCLATGFVQGLWGFGCTYTDTAPAYTKGAPHPRPASAVGEVFTGPLLRQAIGRGFEHLVVYPQAYRALDQRGAPQLRCDGQAVVTAISQVLGPPAHQDDLLVAWELRAPSHHAVEASGESGNPQGKQDTAPK